MSGRGPVSDLAMVLMMSLFSSSLGVERFIKCNDRAELVRTWLPMQYEGPKSWLDQLVYDYRYVVLPAFPLNPCQTQYVVRVEQQLVKNCLIKPHHQTNARSSTKSRCGSSTPCKTTSCKLETPSWMKIAR